MKIKDIEKNLKNEQENNTIPDVLQRVKKAPLNKLLTGETPARAFQKKLAIWLLSVASVLFLTGVIAISAMWFTSSPKNIAPDCYVGISIQRTTEGDDVDYMRLGVLIRPDNSIVSITLEMEDGKDILAPIVSYSAQISDFIKPNPNDKVLISVLGENINRCYALAKSLVEDISFIYDYSAVISANVNDSDIRFGLCDYIKARGGSVAASASISELISEYASL